MGNSANSNSTKNSKKAIPKKAISKGSVKVTSNDWKISQDVKNVPLINQDQKDVCWAACIAMMLSWRDNKLYSIQEALKQTSPEIIDLYVNNMGLSGQLKNSLINSLGLARHDIKTPNMSILVDLLKKGPIYSSSVMRESFAGDMHARVITGIYSNDLKDLEQSFLTILDPMESDAQFESASEFIEKYKSPLLVFR